VDLVDANRVFVARALVRRLKEKLRPLEPKLIYTLRVIFDQFTIRRTTHGSILKELDIHWATKITKPGGASDILSAACQFGSSRTASGYQKHCNRNRPCQ
jgi:hypothetical protein